MATLELRKDSRWWYGRWTENGRVIVRNLDVEVLGVRPGDERPEGDRRFLASRAVAQSKLDEFARAATTRRHLEGLAQAVHVARTGHRVGTIPLERIYSAWQDIPRKHATLSEVYLMSVQGVFRRFVEFFTARYPAVKELSAVTHEMAQTFLAAERSRGVSGRSYNFGLSLLRSTFNHLRRTAGIIDNPFDEIVSQDEATVHRIPFTPPELQRIMDAAKGDPFCRPLFVTGICTAMRRGDVCQLRWADVDMENRFITVNTSKTGAKVSIPMFAMLWEELNALPRTNEYCFPEQAAMYQANPNGIAHRLARVFAAAGFQDTEEDSEETAKKRKAQRKKVRKGPPTGEIMSETEMLQRGRPRILGCKEYTSKVTETMLRVFERYMAGGTSGDIRKEFTLSKAGVSTYLSRIEQVVGFPVVRGRRPTAKPTGPVQVARPGLKKVNQRGFHALRASWVTIALTAGVPVDLVRKVTGHSTVEMVLTHYFQPGREDFRRTLQAAMPALLTNGAPTRDEQMLVIIDRSSAKTWKKDLAELRALITGDRPTTSQGSVSPPQ